MSLNLEPAAPEAADPKRWRTLAVTQVAGFMTLLDVSIVNVALPSIQRDLGASAGTVQWVVSGYALAFGLALVPAGRLGDTLGRRRMFLIALSAFVVTSAFSGAAPTVWLLIGARLLQGVAGGMLTPQNSALIQDLFRGAERGRAFGVLGATIGLSTAVGPVVGGLILAAFPGPDGWRGIFYVNVPIGLVALVLAARLVPSTSGGGSRGAHLDVVGSLLLGGGVLSLLLPLVQAETGGLGRWWWLLGVAVLLLATFAWWEARTVRRGRQPLVDPRLAHTSGYTAGLGIGLVYFIGFTGIWLVFALFFQDGLGYSPLRSGLAVTPFALGVAASAVIAGRLVGRLGRWLTVSGLAAVTVGLAGSALVLRHVDGDAAAWAAAGPLLVGGLGGGMVTSPNITLTLESVPVRMAGVAGGALQTAQRSDRHREPGRRLLCGPGRYRPGLPGGGVRHAAVRVRGHAAGAAAGRGGVGPAAIPRRAARTDPTSGTPPPPHLTGGHDLGDSVLLAVASPRKLRSMPTCGNGLPGGFPVAWRPHQLRWPARQG